MSKLIYIIGRQRSGTTVLRELLVKYGAFNADEIFHGDLSGKHRFYSFVASEVEKEPRFVNPVTHSQLYQRYLESLIVTANGQPVVIDMKYFAFNLIPTDGDITQRTPFLIRHLEKTHPPVFHVIRKNKLRVYVSELMAKKTGKWSARTGTDLPTDKGQVRLDPLKTILSLKAMEQDDRSAREMLANIADKREIIYETMFRRDGSFSPYVMSACEKVLGMTNLDPTPNNTRMNPEPLSALVENFNEIAVAMNGTEYAWMIKADS